MDIPVHTPRARRRYLLGGGAIASIALVTLAVSRMEPALPTIDVGSVWTDSIRRGDMVREVSGAGTLVPEQARWVVATTAGRVERLLVQPGQSVGADDVLLVLSNPDVQVEGLDAERQLSAAESELATLHSTLQTQILDQQAALATTRSRYREAQRQLDSYRELSGRSLISAHDLAAAEDLAQSAAAHALRQQALYTAGLRFDAWLFRLTRNLWIDTMRRRHRDGGADTATFSATADPTVPPKSE